MSINPIPEPQETISFRDWVSANALQAQNKPLNEILQLLGIDQSTWTQINDVYMSYLKKKLAADPLFGNVYAEMFSNPTLANSSPQSKVLAREEFMRIQGILDEGNLRGEDPAVTLQKIGITQHDLAVAGRQYMQYDTRNFTPEQFKELQETLDQDDISRVAIYREKYLPTYEAYVAYNSRLQDFRNEYYVQHSKLDASVSEQYEIADALEKEVDIFHKKNGLTVTGYNNLKKYWENWKRERDIEQFKSVFATADDFFEFYLSVLNFSKKNFTEEMSEEAYNLAEQQYLQLLSSRGYDYSTWGFAEYYGVNEFLSPEQKETVMKKQESLYNY
jgi:hypothetical protein